jgi:outer membrane lipoprotein-sorting protein
MRPTVNIKRLLSQANYHFDEATRREILDDARQALGQSGRESAAAVPVGWRKFMKKTSIPFAVAAAVLIVAGLVIYVTTGSIDIATVAWADVQKELQKIRPHSYLYRTQYADGKTFSMRHYERNSYGRREERETGEIFIFDASKVPNELLILNPDAKKAVKTIYTDTTEPKHINFDVLGFAQRVQSTDIKSLGSKTIEGKVTIGFHYPDPNNDFTIWVDTQTRLPVYVELVQPGRTIIMSEFQYPDSFDPALFSTEPPAGYELKVRKETLKQNQPIVKVERYSCTFTYRYPDGRERIDRTLRKDLSHRREIRTNGTIFICDLSGEKFKMLTLDPKTQKAKFQEGGKGPAEDPDIINIALRLKNGNEKTLAAREINGKSCKGFEGTTAGGEDWSVWVDPESGMPVLIEAKQQKRLMILSDFDYKTPLDDSLFDVNAIPPGYELVKEPQ